MIVFVEPGCGNSGSGRMWVLLGASPGAIFPAALLKERPQNTQKDAEEEKEKVYHEDTKNTKTREDDRAESAGTCAA